MKITIEYESSWRNSFLDGNNNEKPSKNGRKFIASVSALNGENYKRREITIDTVMGVLNRLIGDQKKLYQSRQNSEYYFSDIENKISFEDQSNRYMQSEEIVYLRNFSGNTDQNSFTGLVRSNDPIFNSDYSKEFWSILSLDFEELCDFIIDDTPLEKNIDLNPVTVIRRLEGIQKEKPIVGHTKGEQAAQYLQVHFEKLKPHNKKSELLILPLYCSALYLQLGRLESRYDMSSAKAPRGGIAGISNNGFTTKDFMGRYTGGKKLVYGNPYLLKERVKGEGEVVRKLIKASGQLVITLDIERNRAEELEQMIENAGVSSFYLGKKGLAYVTHINPREVNG